MSTTAIVTTTDGQLTADSTLTIDGTIFPIPDRGTLWGRHSTTDVRRIVQAIEDAGYRKVGLFQERETDVVEIEVELAASRRGIR